MAKESSPARAKQGLLRAEHHNNISTVLKRDPQSRIAGDDVYGGMLHGFGPKRASLRTIIEVDWSIYSTTHDFKKKICQVDTYDQA